MSATSARRLAREVVTQVRERTAYSHEVLDAKLRSVQLPPAEISFATKLSYGAIQTQGTLDEAVDRYLSGRRIEPRVRDALAVSAYELLFLGTEPRVAVHQGVELVRALRPQAAGLANAVLRRLADDTPAFPWGDPESDTAALARLHGHPLWLAEMWIAELGREAAAQVMAADNEPAPLYLAVNTFAGPMEGAQAALLADGAEPLESDVPGCIEAGDSGAAVRGKALRDGNALVCDATAQAIVGMMHAEPGQRLLEVGSGRGTKTLLLQASALAHGGPADLWAVDLHRFKARLLAERIDAFGVPGVLPLTGDATHMASVEGMPEAGSLDAVLIDSPCSGLGTLRRHPEKRWRVTPADMESLSALGVRLLEQAASLVRPGGFVVYSTCTVARQENEAVIEAFLSSELGSEWTPDSVRDEVPADWRRFITQEGYFSSHPVSGGPDGHFAARLVRT